MLEIGDRLRNGWLRYRKQLCSPCHAATSNDCQQDIKVAQPQAATNASLPALDGADHNQTVNPIERISVFRLYMSRITFQ